jgi:hypothetical protein
LSSSCGSSSSSSFLCFSFWTTPPDQRERDGDSRTVNLIE